MRRLLADVGDIHRFRDRDRFASWNRTAPLDASSGQQQRHRLSRAGNRKINRVLHTMAIIHLRRPSPDQDAMASISNTTMPPRTTRSGEVPSPPGVHLVGRNWSAVLAT
ncbi:transposase [Nocardia sp. KC 131]|uniref:transposase n=1 Tax=Nocardia arseniciresistens TaxID=3392119 RepID=UPI00398F089B